MVLSEVVIWMGGGEGGRRGRIFILYSCFPRHNVPLYIVCACFYSDRQDGKFWEFCRHNGIYNHSLQDIRSPALMHVLHRRLSYTVIRPLPSSFFRLYWLPVSFFFMYISLFLSYFSSFSFLRSPISLLCSYSLFAKIWKLTRGHIFFLFLVSKLPM